MKNHSGSDGGLVAGQSIGAALQTKSVASLASCVIGEEEQFFTPTPSEGTLKIADDNAAKNISVESVPSAVKNSTLVGMEEFDPIELMLFDSPCRATMSTDNLHEKAGALVNHASPSRATLLDLDPMEPNTPNSMPKYSEAEVVAIRRQYEERLERQNEFLQTEIATLQEKYSQSLRVGEEMREIIGEYEKTIENLMNMRRSSAVTGGETMSTSSPSPSLLEEEAEKQRLVMEAQALRISFSNLKMLYEEARRSNDSLKLVSKHINYTRLVLILAGG